MRPPFFGVFLAARLGVVPRVELRGKLALGGYEVGTNNLALDTEAIDLMLMPSFVDYDLDSMFDEDRPVSLRAAALPIVVSIPIDVADRYRVFVAPDMRVGRRQHADGAWSAFGVHIGGSLTGPRSYGSFLPE